MTASSRSHDHHRTYRLSKPHQRTTRTGSRLGYTHTGDEGEMLHWALEAFRADRLQRNAHAPSPWFFRKTKLFIIWSVRPVRETNGLLCSCSPSHSTLFGLKN